MCFARIAGAPRTRTFLKSDFVYAVPWYGRLSKPSNEARDSTVSRNGNFSSGPRVPTLRTELRPPTRSSETVESGNVFTTFTVSFSFGFGTAVDPFVRIYLNFFFYFATFVVIASFANEAPKNRNIFWSTFAYEKQNSLRYFVFLLDSKLETQNIFCGLVRRFF